MLADLPEITVETTYIPPLVKEMHLLQKDLYFHVRDEDVIYFVFHSPCTDGFGAAWSFYKSLKDFPPNRPVKVVFMPESHKWEQTKRLLEMDTSKATVYFGDICPERELLERLHAKTKLLRVFDHHQSAMDQCGDLNYCYFDMTRSGAGIIWDTFHKNTRPKLINYVEAGDLWKKNRYPYTEEILAVLGGVRKKFEEWDAFSQRIYKDFDGIVREGKQIVKYREQIQQMLLGRKVHKLKVGGITMPAVNASIFQSGLGHILTSKIGPCGAVWHFNGKYWAFSLRSDDKGPDVAKIAERYGGGGHRNAAGFRIDDLNLLSDLYPKTIHFIPYEEDELDEIEAALESDIDSVIETILTFGFGDAN